jgi:hypothetical protein
LKEVIASNRRKRLSCSSSDRMMSCSCFASTLLSLQSRSDSTGSCSEPAAVEKSVSTDSSNAPSPPPLGCPVDAVTSDHLISFQSLLKVSESWLYMIIITVSQSFILHSIHRHVTVFIFGLIVIRSAGCWRSITWV